MAKKLWLLIIWNSYACRTNANPTNEEFVIAKQSVELL
jgi:hypothetical protein